MAQLERAGKSWRSYQEDIPIGVCPIQSAGLYGAKHNPMVFFQDVSGSPPSPSNAGCMQNVRPLSFGGGIHHCLGAQLARLEAELVFTALVTRLPTLELPEKDKPAWRRSFTLRGLTALPAVWH